MANNQLSALQLDFLRAFFQREDRFFLTGGAALVGFYQGHRQTYDLDLFTLEDAMSDGMAALPLGNPRLGGCSRAGVGRLSDGRLSGGGGDQRQRLDARTLVELIIRLTNKAYPKS